MEERGLDCLCVWDFRYQIGRRGNVVALLGSGLLFKACIDIWIISKDVLGDKGK